MEVTARGDIGPTRPYPDGDQAWAALVDAAPAGVLLLHEDGRLVRANAAAGELLGLDANRLLAAYTSDYLQLAARLRHLTGRDPSAAIHRQVQRVVRADGRTRWVEIQLVPIARPGTGQPFAAAYLVDQTRPYLQERAVRAQLSGASAALRHAGATLIVTDDTGRVLRSSPAADGFIDPDAGGRPLAHALGLAPGALDDLIRAAADGEPVDEVHLALERPGPAGRTIVNATVSVTGYAEPDGDPVPPHGSTATRLAWVFWPARSPETMARSSATAPQLRTILPFLDETLTLIDQTGRTLSIAGPGDEDLLGYPTAVWEAGIDVFELVEPTDQVCVEDAFARLLAAPGSRVSGGFRARTAQGRTAYLEGWAVNLLHDPDVAAILVVTRDVTARRRTEAFLLDRTDILREIASAAPLEVTLRPLVELVDRHLGGATAALVQHRGNGTDGEPSYTSRAFPLEDVRPLLDALGAAAPAELRVVADLEALREFPDLHASLQLAGCRSLVVVPVSSAMAEPESGRHPGLGVLVCLRQHGHAPDPAELELLREVAELAALAIEREQAERGLAHQALHDELTGLANRHLLLDRLEQALNRAKRRGRRLALMFLDLDRFKTINDTLGHDVGDQLLRQFAERLRILVRPEDTVARFGGDEFVVLVEHVIDEQEATQIADRLEAAMNEPFRIGGQDLAVTASVGIVIGEGDDQPASLLRNADIAMYRAKELGRNRTEIYDTRLETHLADRTQLGLDLRAALVEGHLRLVYQPIVELRSGQIRMVEALLRWDHPQHGRLLPLDFLDAAEDSGQGLELGAWVIERGLTDVAVFARATAAATAPTARTPKLCINLSARQLAHPELVARVELALARHHFVPHDLVIDVPETALATAGAMTLRNLENLHQLGVGIAIDDVGAGPSTTLLGILERVPADLLKVDPSVIASMGSAERGTGDRRESLQRSMAAGLLGLGRGLGLTVVAEGVDNPRRLQQLRQLGFDLAQGHVVGAPVDADQMLRLLQA